ncbi:MAG: hypothetical protein U9O41_05040 [Candidatus Aerophobetes bacterium]|nr:hypothetical protein [Candidatus Aerophobetes bacterium]
MGKRISHQLIYPSSHYLINSGYTLAVREKSRDILKKRKLYEAFNSD